MKANIFILLFAACVVHCLARCTQKPNDIAESYICENINGLGELEVVPPSAQKITILNSNIQSLPGNSFVKWALALRYLNITRSQLSDIKDGAFTGLSVLEELIIDENKIKTVRENWVKDIPNLKVLRVWKNEIDSIEPGVFKHLGRLQILDIAYNKINYCLTEEHLEKLKQLDTLYVVGNPWPLRCRPPVIFYLDNRHVNLVHKWGTTHLIIADCIAHEPGAQWNDLVLQECYEFHTGTLSSNPSSIITIL